MTTWNEMFGDNAPEPPDRMTDLLRKFLQDLVERNRLLGGMHELADDELAICLKFALDDWNVTPPFTSFTFETHPSVRLLFHGAAIEAHKLAGQVQSRNQLTYTDGGINVAVSDKAALNQSWIQLFMQDYENKKRSWKTAWNLGRAYGAAWSEYKNIADA